MTNRALLGRLVNAVCIVSLLLFSEPPAALAETPAPTTVIGEVMWAGSSASQADEWIELWNLSDVDAPLAGFALHGAAAEPIAFPDGAAVPARGTYLVANYAADDPKSALATPPDFVTTAVSLSNSALRVALVDPNGVELDVVGDGGAPKAGTSGDSKASMVRDGGSWITATSSIGFDDDSPDFGTPGVCDGCVESVEEVPETAKTETVPEDLLIDAASSTDPAPGSETATSTDPLPESIVENPSAEMTTSTEQTIDRSEDEPPIVDGTATSTEPVADEPAPEADIASEATSTEALPVNTEQATSTEPLENAPDPFDETQNSISTEPEMDPPITSSPTSTEMSESEASNSTSTPTQTQTTSESAGASPPASGSSPPNHPRYDLLRVNEFMAQPDGENEWIEITTLDPNQPVSLAGVQIHDGSGKIYTFATGTVDGSSPFVRVFLSSAKLNNSGDRILLMGPNGNPIDDVTFDGSERAKPWARDLDGTGAWRVTLTPTPGAANIIAAHATAEEPLPETEAPETEVAPASEPEPASMTSATQTMLEQSAAPAVPATSSTAILKSASKSASSKTAAKPKSPPKPSATKAKPKTASAKAKTAPAPKPISFDMTSSDENRGIRVALTGRVGSPPGLITGHGFVLLSPEGRGLLVRVPTSRKLPALGEMLDVSGTLLFTDAGVPYLKINASDAWKSVADAQQAIAPRKVELAVPSAEEAWSLVQITGTILSIKGGTVTVDVEGLDISVTFRKAAGFRVSKLKSGDTIRVTGLLDPTADQTRILPRAESDIEIVAHAPQAVHDKPSALPGWMPFGAAGMAIAGTEGFKQLRERRKRLELEKIAKTISNDGI